MRREIEKEDYKLLLLKLTCNSDYLAFLREFDLILKKIDKKVLRDFLGSLAFEEKIEIENFLRNNLNFTSQKIFEDSGKKGNFNISFEFKNVLEPKAGEDSMQAVDDNISVQNDITGDNSFILDPDLLK